MPAHAHTLTWPPASPAKFDGFLFDSDGVLVDSGKGIEVAWREWFKDQTPPGITVDEVLARQSGRRPVDLIRELCAEVHAGWSDTQIEESAELLLYLQGQPAALRTISAMPGAQRLLNELQDANAPWAVVTSAPRWLAERRLLAAQLPIPSGLVAGDEVTHGKPHAEPFSRGAQVIGVPAGRCVGFEDAAKGIQSIKAAGCGAAVGLETTEASLLLDRAGADVVIPNLSAVHAVAREGRPGLYTVSQITHRHSPIAARGHRLAAFGATPERAAPKAAAIRR